MEPSDIGRIEYLAERQRRRRVVLIVVPGLAALIMLFALMLIDRESYVWQIRMWSGRHVGAEKEL